MSLKYAISLSQGWTMDLVGIKDHVRLPSPSLGQTATCGTAVAADDCIPD